MTNLFQMLCLLLSCYLAASSPSCTRFKRHNGSIPIYALEIAAVINETNVASLPDCLMRCRMRGCSLAVVMTTTRICQLVLINGNDLQPVSASSPAPRLFGSEAEASVWTTTDFQDQLQIRRSNISTTFNNSSTGRNGTSQQITINVNGCYRIEIAGAQGGNHSFQNKLGGMGALCAGNFSLTAGTQLTIVVGQMGGQAASTSAAAGGGGGSFVYKSVGNHLLIAAGGGGGAAYHNAGKPGSAGVDGSDSVGAPTYSGIGGVNGQPGFTNFSYTVSGNTLGGSGAGWLGRPVNSRSSNNDGDRGSGLADGWIGGVAGVGNTGDGGYGGGGGGGAADNYGAGGAGGGYSGGGACVIGYYAGGGGGSYCSGSGCIALEGGNTGRNHGYVTLKMLAPFADAC